MIPLRDANPSRRLAVVNIALVLLNVAAFLYEISLGPRLGDFVMASALTPAEFLAGGGVARFGPMFVSMFLHGGWAHLIGNMLFLWIFGDNVEDRLGHLAYLAFYLAAGVAAAFAHIAFDPASTTPMVGASGAVAGVLGAYLVLYPGARVLTIVPIFFLWITEVPAWLLLVMWFGLQVLSGSAALSPTTAEAASAVAYWAHVGGFVAGVAVGFAAKTFGRRPRYGR